MAESVEKQQQNQKKHHDAPNHKLREFKPHDEVQVKNFQRGEAKWNEGIVTKRLGPLNYLVKMGDRIKKVHIDHLLTKCLMNDGSGDKEATENWDFVPLDITTEEPPVDAEPPINGDSPRNVTSTSCTTETRRYPQRTRAPVINVLS